MTEETKTPKRGVGSVIREALLAGKTNEDALEAVKAEFPESSTSKSTVSWYRNDLRKDGNPHGVPTASEARKAAAAAAGEGEDPLD